MSAKLWGGRFSGRLDEKAWEYNASLAFDWRLVDYDIRGSIAWAKAIQAAGILNEEELSQILAAFQKIKAEVASGSFVFQPSDEDVHTAIERRLTEICGAAGGKIHTGRSRNDQVITDYLLFLQDAFILVDEGVQKVQTSLIQRAEADQGLLISGYTHLQRSQPLLLSHWWLSFFWPLERDRQRLAQASERASRLPLGSSALAGTPYPIDRAFLARELGFKKVSENSIDAVSARDAAAEFLFSASLIAIHLSQLAESLILFSSSEFGYIELADSYSTGSSLMPQKKNPDPLELTRAKASTIIGRLSGLLTLLKGLPSAYNKDLQEDKVPVFETFDTLMLMLPVTAGVLSTLTINPQKLAAALDPALLATDLADYLVKKGVPFRDAHTCIGHLVQKASQSGVSIDQMNLADYREIHPLFAEDVRLVFDFTAAVNRREVPGGTGPQAVQHQLNLAKSIINSGEPQ